jgi:arylsulfatase A-like enzyme
VIAKNRDLYLHSQRLREYGFKDNIGPDPEGAEQGNAGFNRDPLVADQAIESLDMLEASDDDTPFLLVASFLNPHDIVLFGALWLSFGYDYEQAKKVVPTYGFPPSVNEDLVAGKKPACQADYIKKYSQIFLPQIQVQFYFYLQKLVDFQVGRVWNRLQESKFKDNTIVVFTSDHGDALGSHGGMHQKWHQAYEETTHVPFMISGPGIGEGKKIDILSSHIDILPTLLSLTNLNESKLRQKLEQVHTEAQSLPGRDLKNIIKGIDKEDLPVYFLTEDDISVGTNQFNLTGDPYESVIDPSNVEAAIVRIDGILWKYVRTYKNSLINPPTDDTPESEEFELYDLFNDPIEMINLGYDNIGTTEEARSVMPYLQQLLIELRAEKLRYPTNLDVSM